MKMIIEAIGYLGSILVVISMLMSSVKKLRIINCIGSTIFAGYALVIHSYPTAAMNAFLVGINIYNLMKLRNVNNNYELIEQVEEDRCLQYFIEKYRKDIQLFFPDFTQIKPGDIAYIICCSENIAGILIGTECGNGVLDIRIDYTTPKYRDCSVGAFLYERLAQKKYTKLTCRQDNEEHRSYMEKMGFVKTEQGYEKVL